MTTIVLLAERVNGVREVLQRLHGDGYVEDARPWRLMLRAAARANSSLAGSYHEMARGASEYPGTKACLAAALADARLAQLLRRFC